MKRRRLLLLPVLLLLAACSPYLHIARLGINDRIVRGGQAQIDQGYVVNMAAYPNLIAAHRTTHGSQFRNLPSIRVGERFFTTGFQGHDVQWWVVAAKRVTYSASSAQLAGWPLVLQTSMPRGGRLLVFCRRA